MAVESDPGAGRRRTARALATVLAVAGVLAAAGGGAIALADRSAESPADQVPAGVDYVGHLDPAPLRSDARLAAATRASLRFQSVVSFYAGPAFGRSFALGGAAGLDPGAVRSVTYFGRSDGSGGSSESNGSTYRARVVEAGWRPAAVATAVEDRHGVDLAATTYRGATAYVGGGRAVAALDGGRVAVGNATAVRDAVDVARGGAPSVDGPLRAAFAREAGYVRFAYRFRPATVPRVPFVTDAVRSVERASGSYAAGNDTLRVRANVTVADPEAARAVAGILRAGVTFYRVESRNATMRRQLRAVRVTRAGRVVRVAHAGSPAAYPAFVRGLDRNRPTHKGSRVGRPAASGHRAGSGPASGTRQEVR